MDYICSCGTCLSSHELRNNYKSIQAQRKNKEDKIKEHYRRQDINVAKLNLPESEKDKLYIKNWETYNTQNKNVDIDTAKKLMKLYRMHGIGKFDWCCKMRLQTQISVLDTHI